MCYKTIDKWESRKLKKKETGQHNTKTEARIQLITWAMGLIAIFLYRCLLLSLAEESTHFHTDQSHLTGLNQTTLHAKQGITSVEMFACYYPKKNKLELVTEGD